MAWFALCFTGGLLGSLSRLVQFLTGLRFATLAGIALPGCGLCMAWGVAYVGFHYRPRVLLPVWRLPFRLWPILVLFLLAGVALWYKLASAPSAASGSPIAGGSVPAQSLASDAGTRHATGGTPPAPVTSDVPATGGTPPAPVTSDTLPAYTPAAVTQE
ncbi:hypothetical protein V6N12_068339 [Hibiscus sabdariffa]|uniref:Uncharacterized protein n=1 Tax=Hibiscus sabdariffa TaxID=183260 RepID=A0ABR2FQE7_9ROSI